MKKKSLLTMLLALTLVAVVGVGATLAYLSDSTGTMTNTFTVGNGIDMKQDEEYIPVTDEDLDGNGNPDNDNDGDGKLDRDEDGDGRTEIGNDYTDIQPGDKLVKDPTVTILADSTECYVFMQLEGADELAAQKFTFGGFDTTKWIKVDGAAGLDGVYRYFETVKTASTDQKLAPLFTTVTYSIEAEELADDVKLSDVVIKSCAVQAKNMDETSAYEAAVETINK